MTTAIQLLTLVWKNGMTDSWGRINSYMHHALKLAIGSGLEFEKGDFPTLYTAFRARYWIGSEPEWVYSQAVFDGNKSCIKAWEEHTARTPFYGNDVSTGYMQGFIHRSSSNRARERLAVGFTFPSEGKTWKVTAFVGDCIRIATYDGESRTPKKLRKLSHAEMLELCPAPKKVKAKKEEA